MDKNEKTLSSRTIFSGRLLKLRVDRVSLPDGRESTREIVEHAEAVAVIALDDNNQVWMVKQYRKPIEEVLLEIPAGLMEEGEEPLEAARRELAEETGLRAQKWEKVLSYYSAPGFSNEKLHIYLAQELTSGECNLDSDEFVEVEKVKLPILCQMLADGRIVDGKSIIGIQWLINQRYDRGEG